MRASRGLVIVGLMFLLFKCSPPSEIGATFFSNGSIDINYTDTLSLKVSTLLIDSLITSNSTRLLVGYHTDTYLGSVKSSAIFQVGSQTFSSLNDNDEFEYLALNLKFDGYSSYDTLKPIQFEVYKLTEGLELDNGYLYSSSQFRASRISIGSADLIVEPNFIDSAEVALSNSLGFELFSLVQLKDSRILSNEQFVEYFMGLALVPKASDQSCFIGIDKSSTLRLFYKDNSSVPAKRRYLDFPIGTIYFNQIVSDRSNTLLHELITREFDLKSNDNGNMAVIQSGTGLCLKVAFPYAQQVGYANEKIPITKIELELRPISHLTNSNNTGTLSKLNAYVINNLNEVQSQLDVTATLMSTDILERDVYYSIDITGFLKSIIHGVEQNKYSLLFTCDDTSINSTIDQVFIGDQLNKYQTEVKVYYLDINK